MTPLTPIEFQRQLHEDRTTSLRCVDAPPVVVSPAPHTRCVDGVHRAPAGPRGADAPPSPGRRGIHRGPRSMCGGLTYFRGLAARQGGQLGERGAARSSSSTIPSPVSRASGLVAQDSPGSPAMRLCAGERLVGKREIPVLAAVAAARRGETALGVIQRGLARARGSRRRARPATRRGRRSLSVPTALQR